MSISRDNLNDTVSVHNYINEKLENMEKKLNDLQNGLPKKNKQFRGFFKTLKNFKVDINDIRNKIPCLSYDKFNKMETEISDLQLKNALVMSKLSKIKEVGIDFIKKLLMSKEILESMKSQMEGSDFTGGIVGSFSRQFFELPFALADECEFNLNTENQNIGIGNFGNSKNHDLDIIIFEKINANMYHYATEYIVNYMNRLNDYLNLYNIDKSNPRPNFGDYILKDIIDITITSEQISDFDSIGKKNLIGIPHYNFKLIDDGGNNVIVDIIGWTPISEDKWPVGDFDVNTLIINNKGIFSINKGIDFFETISNISQRKAKCLINLPKLCKPIKESFYYSNLQNEQLSNLKQFSFFVSNRLKILDYGYKYIDSDFGIPDIKKEEKDDCYITYTSPPFLNITLVCGHKISSIALLYLTNNKIINSFDFRCPICRKSFAIKFLKPNGSNLKIDSWWNNNKLIVVDDFCQPNIDPDEKITLRTFNSFHNSGPMLESKVRKDRFSKITSSYTSNDNLSEKIFKKILVKKNIDPVKITQESFDSFLQGSPGLNTYSKAIGSHTSFDDLSETIPDKNSIATDFVKEITGDDTLYARSFSSPTKKIYGRVGRPFNGLRLGEMERDSLFLNNLKRFSLDDEMENGNEMEYID